MKSTKPFDLELAKAGHPLVLSNGGIVLYVGVSPVDLKSIIVADTQRLIFINATIKAPELHLLLNTSEPWEAPLKQGDIIEVLINKKWKDSAYICPMPKGKFLSTDPQYNDPDALNKGNVDCDEIKLFCDKDEGIDWRRKPTGANIEITVKVNGVESVLSCISEETLLKIRKNS